MLALVLRSPAQTFGRSGLARSAARAMHYAGLVRRFSAAQFKEIFLDKYDAGYQWRSRFASRQQRCAEPVVLLPSAYGNVSRMAAAYARLLPEQAFSDGCDAAERQAIRRPFQRSGARPGGLCEEPVLPGRKSHR